MPETPYNQYDILVAGAGFAGSLTALVLRNLGFKVCLLEKGQHPRFTIGESSTPVADMILRNLASKYNLPWLHDFSRYGNELLVTASFSDIQSDTNWLRADFDTFLVNKVKESGIDYFDLSEIITAKRNAQWEFHVSRFNERNIIHASFFIDATGSSGLLDKLLGIESSSGGFLTNSFAIFSHFNHVPRWTDMLQKAGIPSDDFPYNPDYSALHHILDEGWLWMLRFNDQRTSLGFVLDGDTAFYENLQTEEIWNDMLKKYPSINNIIKDASLATQPGKIIRSARLQRRIKHCFGPGWVALPHTAGFVDPLFSSGIAHTLSGVEKIIHTISQYWGNDKLLQ